jgi:hypothetical protein
MNEHPPIILVTGFPRSGTSLVSGVIRACGAFTGETTGPSPYNAKGNVENTVIREKMIKEYLRKLPACPLGLRSLPIMNHAPVITPSTWRAAFMLYMRRQGYKSGPIVYKDAKIALMWRVWAQAFPDARWVITSRHSSEIISSVMAAEPMRKHLGDRIDVENWYRSYEMHVDSIPRPLRVNPFHADREWWIRQLGLEYNADAVNEWVDMGLKHHGIR